MVLPEIISKDNAARLCSRWFPDFAGIYWADGNMLEVDAR